MSSKTTYHHGDLRQALLRAADAVLRDHGLQGFTLRECARRAGVSHAAPKHHFGDVRGLLTEVAVGGFERLNKLLRSKLRAAGADLDRQFAATAEAYVGFAEAHPEHFRIMFRSDLVDASSPRLLAAARRTFTDLTNVIRRQRGEPDVEPVDLDSHITSAQLLDDILIGWCHIHGYAHLKMEGQLSMVPKPVQKAVLTRASLRLGRLIQRDAAPA